MPFGFSPQRPIGNDLYQFDGVPQGGSKQVRNNVVAIPQSDGTYLYTVNGSLAQRDWKPDPGTDNVTYQRPAPAKKAPQPMDAISAALRQLGLR